MLPLLILAPPPVPQGTTTMTVLCDWLTAATGKPHAPSGALRDYPVFLSVRDATPARVEKLVALALAGEWTQDGSTLRLIPTKPLKGEGEAEFARGWAAAAKGRAALAALPSGAIFALRAGEMVRFGTPTGPYVRPLPDVLRKKAEAGEGGAGYVYVWRFANGYFETRVDLPNEQQGPFDRGAGVEFRLLPPEVAAALGEDAGKPALNAEEAKALTALPGNPGAAAVDPKTLERTDPLVRFMDPILKPLARGLKRDLVVALPDQSITALFGGDKSTVGAVMGGFCLTVDWTLAPGAFVGRLPVGERRNPAQARRSAIAAFVRQTRGEGVPSSAAMGAYVASQRPVASDSWSDAMLLALSGVVLDQSNIGDYPYNLRLAGALTPGDWTRLRSGRILSLAELSAGARDALLRLMVQSRERMNSGHPDPVRTAGFPNIPLTIVAKVEDELTVLGFQDGIINVMTAMDAGAGYQRAKAKLGTEPRYRAARRRKLTLTISPTGGTFWTRPAEPKAGPWTALPPEWRAAFAEGNKARENTDEAIRAGGGTP